MWQRKRRLVRVHLTGNEPSIEGVWMGRVGKHYRLEAVKVIQSAETSHDLEGTALVPVERVAFVQVLHS
jgi:hypothetical protein